MEYLDGGDLAAWLAERGPLPIDLAVDFVLHACEAIAEAHALGIVHRDLKPANLFCVKKPDGTLSVKVLDFGISKLMIADALPQQLTTTGTFMGSPRYMSPEQMKLSKAVDGRTDIWSLGIILFELLAGVAPFDAEGVTDLAIKVATEAAASLRTYREDAPAALEAVVVRCLEKDRESRYQTIAEMALALEPFGTSRARASVLGIVGTLRQAAHSAENRGPIAAPAGPQPPKMVASDGPLPVVRREERPVVGATTAEPVATERGATPRRAGRRNDRRWVLACALLLLAGGGVAAAVGIASKEQPSTASARGAAPDSTPGRAEPAAASADPGAWTEAPPSVSTGASMPTRVPSTVPVPPRVRAASSAPVGPSPEPLRALPAPSAECDPPTWQDERGHIHLKKGCR
jgi:serine/threonine-protein kinase